jgi:hypothetical protein
MSSSDYDQFLKPIPTQPLPESNEEIGFPPSLPDLLQTMGRLTDCSFYFTRRIDHVTSDQHFFPVRGKPKDPMGYLVVEYPPTRRSELQNREVEQVVETLTEFLSENFRWQQSVKEQEALLASNITCPRHVHNDRQLAIRLQAILKAGAKIIGCHAAGCYLLDEETTELKLRTSWGLPSGQLIEPARPLEGALADLEAMLGHAVVLEDDSLTEHWNPPECFPSSVCVPLSTSTTILGTLWFFCNETRDFTDDQTNLVEIIAGRIASELERESLLRSARKRERLLQCIQKADQFLQRQLPGFAPEVSGWKMEGRANHPDRSIAGSFYDWLTLPNGQVAFAVGNAGNAVDFQNALIASAMRTAWRSCAFYEDQTSRVLERVNETLWTSFLGESAAKLCLGTIQADNPVIVFSGSGSNFIYRFGKKNLSFEFPSPALGKNITSKFHLQQCALTPGEALLILSFEENLPLSQEQQEPVGKELQKIIQANLQIGATDLAQAINRPLEAFARQKGVGNSWILLKREK